MGNDVQQWHSRRNHSEKTTRTAKEKRKKREAQEKTYPHTRIAEDNKPSYSECTKRKIYSYLSFAIYVFHFHSECVCAVMLMSTYFLYFSIILLSTIS